MLMLATVIRGSTLNGIDGKVGTVKDMLFDQQTWMVRYFEVNPGGWLKNRRILLAPSIVAETDWPKRRLAVSLTRERVKDSPHVDADLWVSRAEEVELSRHFSWDPYWTTRLTESCRDQGEPRLQSTKETTGYDIHTIDGTIGHVGDLIVDDETWEVRYLVVDTGSWLSGKTVLVAPLWADVVDWEGRVITLGIDRKKIENCPAFEPKSPVNRDYEEVLYDYHARPKYWFGSRNGPEGR